jgi:dihydroflavonol-4-reductase
MKILIVGGTGQVGGHAALRLSRRGHRVVIAGRRPAPATTELPKLDFLTLDYMAGDTPKSALSSFDAVIFAAGQDVRMMPPGSDEVAYMWHANAEAVPAFFETLRQAGVPVAINIGTFYPQVAPALTERDPYMRARKASDEAIRGLASESFRAFSINPPWVAGAVPGMGSILWDPYLAYAAGLTDLPQWLPPGGCAFISGDSLDEAIEGGLARGEAGASYLVNGENMSFADYLGAMFDGFGRPRPPIGGTEQEHPVISDLAVSWGRGGNLFYDTNPRETALLGYRQGDVARSVRQEMVPDFKQRMGL